MDLTDYGRGLSGQGGADYNSAAWRAGDSERVYQENQKFIRSANTRSNIAYDRNPGFISYILRIVFFVFICFLGAAGLVEEIPKIENFLNQHLGQYVGTGKVITADTGMWIAAGFLAFIGFFLRKILVVINWLLVFSLIGFILYVA